MKQDLRILSLREHSDGNAGMDFYGISPGNHYHISSKIASGADFIRYVSTVGEGRGIEVTGSQSLYV